MPMLLFIFCLALLYLYSSKCEVLPSIIWNPRNPIFDAKNCRGGNEIQAKSNDVMTIICPIKTLVAGMQQDVTNNDELHENVWFTSDVTAADRCNATTAHLLMKCDKPAKYKPYSINVRYGITQPVFERQGQRYFLFSTGTGKKEDLENKVGGHCKTNNMIFSIYYCRYTEECKRTEMYTCGNNKEEKTPTTKTTITKTPKTKMTSKKTPTIKMTSKKTLTIKMTSTKTPTTKVTSTKTPIIKMTSTKTSTTKATSTNTPTTKMTITKTPTTKVTSTETPSTKTSSGKTPDSKAPDTNMSSTKAPNVTTQSTKASSVKTRSTESTITTSTPRFERVRTKIVTVVLTVPQINHRDKLINRNALSDLSEGGTGLVVFATLAIGGALGAALATVIMTYRNSPNLNLNIAGGMARLRGIRDWFRHCTSSFFANPNSASSPQLWGFPMGSSIVRQERATVT